MTNLPWDEKSLGKGLGQQTGGGATSDADEAMKLLKMVELAGGSELVGAILGEKSANFVDQLITQAAIYNELHVTGKQLFWLRDIKDRLVERGYI